jgi:predicted ATPase with chaperone activity
MNPSATLFASVAARKPVAPPPEPPQAVEPPPAVRTLFKPAPPASLAEAGLSDAMVDALVFKYLLTAGSSSGARVAAVLALPHPLIVERLADLKRQQLVGYVGSATMGDFTYTLTETGRDRARRFMDECMYVGAAPVPLGAYCDAVKAQSITLEKPDEARLRDAFSDLLINNKMFATLGPAINSGRGMFLYGYPGNGKTSIAERITRCFGNEIYIPYAIHVDGFIIKLFDAEIHTRVETPRNSILKSDALDDRWVRITRPTVIVGGELTMDSLEVRYNHTTRISEASMQLKSNCGTLVIDDFGRQRMNPVELLNRWIVPLEKRFDFLALANGQKIQVPFDQLLVFSTNLEPRDLVDDAFLRRIPYKINVCDPTEEEFRELFKIMCRIVGFEYQDALITRLIEQHYQKTGRPFRCCQPRDLLLLAKNRAQYASLPMELNEEALDFAADVYFTIM